MARQRIVHGAFVDMVTPDEMYKMIPRPPEVTRMRVPISVELDAAGTTGGIIAVYKVPIGMEFEARRVSLELGNIPGPLLGTSIALNTPGQYVEYFRSGTHISFGCPTGPAGSSPSRVPGVETWGDQQGPYLRNGEVFGVFASLAAASANVSFSIMLEGLLTAYRKNA